MTSHMKHSHLLTFGSVMLVAWAVGTFLFIYFWPSLLLSPNVDGQRIAMIKTGSNDVNESSPSE